MMNLRKQISFVAVFFFVCSFTSFAEAGDRRHGHGRGDTALVAVVATIATIFGLSFLLSSKREETNQKEVDAWENVALEDIRANTVTKAPESLHGEGSAVYSSPNGEARIAASRDSGAFSQRDHGSVRVNYREDSGEFSHDVSILRGLRDHLDDLNASEKERVALSHAIRELEDIHTPAYKKSTLRNDLDFLVDLKVKTANAGLSQERAALERSLTYLEGVVFH